MQRRLFKAKEGPEAKIQRELIDFLKVRDWLVKETHGNIYQFGFPDLYAAHRKYGQRWVEVKNATKYEFTPAQLEFFPQLVAHGIGVWILVAATEAEYEKLFKPCNWYHYLMMKL